MNHADAKWSRNTLKAAWDLGNSRIGSCSYLLVVSRRDAGCAEFVVLDPNRSSIGLSVRADDVSAHQQLHTIDSLQNGPFNSQLDCAHRGELLICFEKNTSAADVERGSIADPTPLGSLFQQPKLKIQGDRVSMLRTLFIHKDCLIARRISCFRTELPYPGAF